jgi:hypothetical protein
MEEKMRKILLFLLLSLFLATIFTGCGDEDDDNPTAPTPNDVENLDFVMSIMYENYDYQNRDQDELMISITPIDYDNSISTISLEINGEVVELQAEDYLEDYYYGWVYATAGDVLDCALQINSSVANLSLQVPAYPEVDWPENYDPASLYDLTWQLEFDSQYQFLSGYGETYDWENWETIDEDENLLDLMPSARFTNLPANWLKSGLEDYDLTLEEIFFDYDGEIAGMAAAFNTEYYWSSRTKNADTDFQQKMRLQRVREIAQQLSR